MVLYCERIKLKMSQVNVACRMDGALMEIKESAKVIEIASACNNHCKFCNLDESGDGARVLGGSDSTQAQLSESYSQGYRDVTFVGAEPTLSDYLPEALASARAAGFERIGLQTNGRRLAYRSYTASLEQAGLTHVEITLHGPRGGVHDFHTDVPNSFAHTVQGTLVALKAGLKVGVSTMVTRSNFRELEGLVFLFVKLKVRHWQLAGVLDVGAARANGQALTANMDMAAPYVRRALAVARQHGISVSFLNLSLPNTEAESALESQKTDATQPRTGEVLRPAVAEPFRYVASGS